MKLPLAAEVAGASVVGYWPSEQLEAAYLLYDDGRLYRCTRSAASLRLRLPLHGEKELQWRRYGTAGDTLFALTGTSLVRADVRSGGIEKKDLRRIWRELRLPERYVPRIEAVNSAEVALIVEPLENADGKPQGASPSKAAVYLLPYSTGVPRLLTALPARSALARSATSQGVASGTDAIWVLAYDFDSLELVPRRLPANGRHTD